MSERFASISLVAVLAISGCAPRTRDYSLWPPLGADSSEATALAGIESRDAAQDAREATGRGEYALIGIQGYALAVPGLPNWEGHARRFGVWVVRVNCEIIDARTRHLCDVAREYATEYNGRVLEHLRLKPPPN